MNISGFPGKKSIGMLIDPDKSEHLHLDNILKLALTNEVDYILAGGSLTFSSTESLILRIKERCHIPVVLFPGSLLQLSKKADAVLLLSLISGRNPELLIGNHVLAAPYLNEIKQKLIPTGYILINCGVKTSVEYISQTEAIPSDKPDIALATALAGEMLGMKLIYLEGGSGSHYPVKPEIIQAVSQNISVPVCTGGGIRNGKQVEEAFHAGASMVILGNGVERDPGLIADACAVRNRVRMSD